MVYWVSDSVKPKKRMHSVIHICSMTSLILFSFSHNELEKKSHNAHHSSDPNLSLCRRRYENWAIPKKSPNPGACSSLILPLDGEFTAELRNTPPRLNRDVQSPGDNRTGECVVSSYTSAKFTCPHKHTHTRSPLCCQQLPFPRPRPSQPTTANYDDMIDLCGSVKNIWKANKLDRRCPSLPHCGVCSYLL